MIKRIRIKNFKSLHDFELDLSSTTCIIGLNGAGKSSLLQSFSFLSALMTGTVSSWLNERHWEASDLKSYGAATTIIEWDIELAASDGGLIRWSGNFNSNQSFLRCTKETVQAAPGPQGPWTSLLKVADNKFGILGESLQPIAQRYEGSILSSLLNSRIPAECLRIREELAGLRSFDLLNPQQMRTRSRADGTTDIGTQGDRLAAAIHQLGKEDRVHRLLPALQQFFPAVSQIESRKTVGGWIELIVEETFGNRKIRTLARHCPDGLLRILAILTQLMFNKGVACFDEIENGISADLLIKLLEHIRAQGTQVILTTHSITALNFIREDEVRLLYRDPMGDTRAIAFGKIIGIEEYRSMYDVGDAIAIASLQVVTEHAKGAAQ